MHQVHPVGQAGEFGDGRVVRKAYRPFFYAREHQEGAEGGEEDVGGAELPGPFEHRGLDQLAGGVSKKLQGGAKINDFVHCVPPYNWVHVFTVLLRFNVLRAVQLVRTSIPRAPSSVIICSSIF